MRVIAIIPARYHSSRFPGKLLTLILDKPVLQWTYEAVQSTKLFEDVIIATADEKIEKFARSIGARVFKSKEIHQNGTERCAEVARDFDADDVVFNVQGDEPFVRAASLKQLIDLIQNKKNSISTLINKIEDPSELEDTNVVKAVIDKYGRTIYFSRSAIPFLFNPYDGISAFHYKHQGIYAFRNRVLQEVSKLPLSMLEKAEKLEQLRWLENGYPIQTVLCEIGTISINTPDDLHKARSYIKKKR